MVNAKSQMMEIGGDSRTITSSSCMAVAVGVLRGFGV
jgi:hypothetical protein